MAAFQKRSGNWRAIITRKGYPRLTRTFDSKADAERWAGDIEAEMRRGAFVDRTEAEQTTFSEALDRYEREVTPRKKGAKQELLRIRAWKRDPLALRSMASIRGADIAAWRDKRLAAGISPTTIRNDLALVSHLFTVATKEWGLESLSNPVEKIKLPAPGRARDRRLDPKLDANGKGEDVRLLEACDASDCTWLGPLVRIALATAMRQGELLALLWENVDLETQVARLVDTKNGERRDVPLSSAMIRVFAELKGDLDRVGRVFPYRQEHLDDHWRKALKKAEICGLRFHDLRHEATSRLFEKGLNPMEAAAVTGHKTLTMLKRYTHLRAEDLAKKLG